MDEVDKDEIECLFKKIDTILVKYLNKYDKTDNLKNNDSKDHVNHQKNTHDDNDDDDVLVMKSKALLCEVTDHILQHILPQSILMQVISNTLHDVSNNNNNEIIYDSGKSSNYKNNSCNDNTRSIAGRDCWNYADATTALFNDPLISATSSDCTSIDETRLLDGIQSILIDNDEYCSNVHNNLIHNNDHNGDDYNSNERNSSDNINNNNNDLNDDNTKGIKDTLNSSIFKNNSNKNFDDETNHDDDDDDDDDENQHILVTTSNHHHRYHHRSLSLLRIENLLGVSTSDDNNDNNNYHDKNNNDSVVNVVDSNHKKLLLTCIKDDDNNNDNNQGDAYKDIKNDNAYVVGIGSSSNVNDTLHITDECHISDIDEKDKHVDCSHQYIDINGDDNCVIAIDSMNVDMVDSIQPTTTPSASSSLLPLQTLTLVSSLPVLSSSSVPLSQPSSYIPSSSSSSSSSTTFSLPTSSSNNEWDVEFKQFSKKINLYRGYELMKVKGKSLTLNLGVGKNTTKCSLLAWSNMQIRNRSNLTTRQVRMLDNLVEKNLWSWELVEDIDPPSMGNKGCNDDSGNSNSGNGNYVSNECDTNSSITTNVVEETNKSNINVHKDDCKNNIIDTSTTINSSRSSDSICNIVSNANEIKSENKKRKSPENLKKPPQKTVKKIKALSKRAMFQQMEADWYESFGQLIIYEEKYGTYQVPIHYEVEGDGGKIIQLGNWLNIQGLFLEEYKEDNPEWYATLMSLISTGKLSFDNDNDKNDTSNNDHDNDHSMNDQQNNHNSKSSSSSSSSSSSKSVSIITAVIGNNIKEEKGDGSNNDVKEESTTMITDQTQHIVISINQSKQADRLDQLQINDQKQSHHHHHHHNQQQHNQVTPPVPPIHQRKHYNHNQQDQKNHNQQQQHQHHQQQNHHHQQHHHQLHHHHQLNHHHQLHPNLSPSPPLPPLLPSLLPSSQQQLLAQCRMEQQTQCISLSQCISTHKFIAYMIAPYEDKDVIYGQLKIGMILSDEVVKVKDGGGDVKIFTVVEIMPMDTNNPIDGAFAINHHYEQSYQHHHHGLSPHTYKVEDQNDNIAIRNIQFQLYKSSNYGNHRLLNDDNYYTNQYVDDKHSNNNYDRVVLCDRSKSDVKKLLKKSEDLLRFP